MHSMRNSGACPIDDFAGTSTGRGTRRRGNPGRPGTSSGSVRLSDPGFQASSDVAEDRTGSRLRRPDALGRRCSGNRTGIDGRRGGDVTERRRPGADRRPRLIAGSARRRDGKVPDPKVKSNPDLARGRKQRFDRASVPSLNSGSWFFECATARVADARCLSARSDSSPVSVADLRPHMTPEPGTLAEAALIVAGHKAPPGVIPPARNIPRSPAHRPASGRSAPARARARRSGGWSGPPDPAPAPDTCG